MCKHLILVTVCFISLQAPAFASQSSDETIAVYKAAIEAFKAVEHPFTGKGSALVETYTRNNPSKTGKKKFDFMFKGDLSRSVRFGIKEGQLEQPEMLWATGKKCAVTYNYSGGASVQRYPPRQFYHQLGYDFNPSTFMRYYLTPLDVQLERLLDGPSTLSAKMDSDGILHLISDYKDKNVNQQLVVSVNPNMGYRLVGSLAIMERFNQPSLYNYTDFLEVQWDKYESSWYVKSAKFASYDGIHSPEDRASLEPGNLRMSTTVTVTEFHPNVEISDSEFTLNGLKLPVGTPVVDKISGIIYRIGSGPQSTDTLQKPLLEAESAKSIKNQVDIKDVKQDTTAIGERAESEKKTSISNEKSTQESMADTPNHPHKQRNVLIIVTLFVGIILVLVIGWRLLTRIK